MSEYRVNEIVEEEAEDWDNFVQSNPGGNIFQTYPMRKVYEKTKNYSPLHFAVKNSKGEICAGLLAYVSTEKGGILAPFSRRSIVFGGPLYSMEGEDGGGLGFLLKEYKERVKGKAIYTEVRNLFDTSAGKSQIESQGFSYRQHLNFLVDLNQSREQLWAKLKKSRRNGITKSERMGVAIEEVTGRDDIPECYRMLKETYSNARLPLADETLFSNTFEILSPKNLIRIFAARLEEKIIGVIVLLAYKDRVYDWYAGADIKYRKYCPNDVLPWHAITWGKENRYKVFDFGGAGKPGEEYGVRDFKSQYGGDLVEYGRYRLVHSPFKYRLAEKGFSLYRRLIH